MSKGVQITFTLAILAMLVLLAIYGTEGHYAHAAFDMAIAVFLRVAIADGR